MATESKPTNAPNRCDAVDKKAEKKPPPTMLNVMFPQLTASEMIAQTAEYAKHPRTFLESKFGNTYLNERKHLLSIPHEIDKDVYGDGQHKSQFQSHIAALLGKEHGLFFITGVQAQLVAMKIHCEHAGNNRVAWHVSSHLESAEERAFEALYGLERQLLGTKDEVLPTVDEIKKVISLSPSERPAVILVELPNRVLGCQTYTFAELEEISSACEEYGVKFHCDGARLWEIEPFYQKISGKTFADIGQLFDTVYVSFYKGLRGVTGAMLVSNDEQLMKESKMWQRRAGGNAVCLAYEVIDCERGYNENIGTFRQKWKKMEEVVERVKEATEKFKTKDGKQIVAFMPERPTCCQTRTVFQGYTANELILARIKVQDRINVRMFNQLWPKQTLDEKLQAERDSHGEANGEQTKTAEDDRRHIVEWMIGIERQNLDTKVFVDAYVALCEELVAADEASRS